MNHEQTSGPTLLRGTLLGALGSKHVVMTID